MQLSRLLPLVYVAALAAAATVSFDRGYDDGARSLTTVSCSDGKNGLITTRGWRIQSDVTGFPYIGGVEAVEGWNSPNCGTCWELSHGGRTVHVLAVDHADSGFNIALAAMDDLTDGQAEQLGRVDAEAVQVNGSNCGL